MRKTSSEIVLHGVTKEYFVDAGTVIAVQDVSFRVSPGSFYSILGPSGCGKTTLISIIAGFVRPTSGAVHVNGSRVDSPGRDRVVVSQDDSLFSWMTVWKNVEFGLVAGGIARTERHQIVSHFLELVGLAGVADRFPSQLSGGMRRRLALARALAVGPSCLLLDEPLAALDIQMRHALQDELLRLWHETGPTVLLVTHDLSEALYLSDRILVMCPSPGRPLVIVDVEFDRPRHPDLRLSDEFQAAQRGVLRIIEENTGGQRDVMRIIEENTDGQRHIAYRLQPVDDTNV